METVNIYEAKTRLSQLVDKAASGEDVVVCRNGKPLVRITRLEAAEASHHLRPAQGQADRPAQTSTRLCLTMCWPASKAADAAAAGHAHLSVGGCGVAAAEGPDPASARVRRRDLRVGGLHLGDRHQGAPRQDRCRPAELAAAIEPSGFLELPVSAAHAAAVAKLELHHSDPFDRLLIAQALAEPLKLVTADAVLAMYSNVVVVV